jgi:DNA-directed RNA polymerase specialized sigma24 family protein
MTITRNLVAEDARRRLPEDTRIALLLRSEGKLSYEEISAVLGISAGCRPGESASGAAGADKID